MTTLMQKFLSIHLCFYRSNHQSVLQSQEVTYAELTLPRGKGYTQMRRLEDTGVNYARYSQFN